MEDIKRATAADLAFLDSFEDATKQYGANHAATEVMSVQKIAKNFKHTNEIYISSAPTYCAKGK